MEPSRYCHLSLVAVSADRDFRAGLLPVPYKVKKSWKLNGLTALAVTRCFCSARFAAGCLTGDLGDLGGGGFLADTSEDFLIILGSCDPERVRVISIARL